ATKVIRAMFDIGSLRSFITVAYRESTGAYLGNKAGLVLLIVTIIIALFLKNSFEKNKIIKFNIFNRLEIVFLTAVSIFLFNRITTFLYFNF
ncbi:MAG: hypothetical protein ACRCZ9_05255, partial [Fusobacteriaceae bacterium]